MIKSSILAQLCVDLYDPAKRAGWLHYWDAEDVVVAHAKIDDTDILVLRGSTDALDWIRDAEVLPVWDSKLGFVHGGFLRHMDDVLDETKPVIGDNLVITGHSLGGARARVLAALRAANGLPINQVTVFGSPRPGFANMSRIIQKSGMVHTSFRNRNDPVPTVPGLTLDNDILLWKHPEQWMLLNEKPASDDLEPLRDHHIELYLRGVSKLPF